MTRYASCGTPPTHAYGVDHTRPIEPNSANDPLPASDLQLAAQFAGDRPELVVEPDALRAIGGL